ncbi:MAG: SPOR domain-containing protein [Phycisphaerales bacterium]
MQARGRGFGLVGAAIAATLLLVLAGGCASGSRSGSAYAEGRYESALVAARRDASRSTGAKRDRAALTAGLSAHALGRYDEAIVWLEPLESNANPEIAGRASAALGLIARDRGRDAEASRKFAKAADQLNGLDGDRAAAFAGRAHLEARRQATSGVATADTRRTMQSFYTVQVGAFSTRSNAEEAASTVRQRAASAGLGRPRISPTANGRGSLLYLVQVGQFADRHQAEVAARSLGGGMVTLAQAF